MTDVRTHLDRLADDITPPLPPGLLDQARSVRRRRRHKRMGALTGVVVVAAVGVTPLVLDPGGHERLGAPSTHRPDVYVPISLEGSRPVTDRSEVLGEWTVVEVARGPVPPDANAGIVIRAADPDEVPGHGIAGDLAARGITIGFSDGLNSINVTKLLESDGTFDNSTGSGMSTTVGCGAPDEPSSECTSPSGFGVTTASRLRLTSDGQLVFADAGEPLAVYRPSSRQTTATFGSQCPSGEWSSGAVDSIGPSSAADAAAWPTSP